ncbi:alpha/beta hydrolase [Chloroflexi bacterium TSY]|nr:alpha/beta hydrolase [Chloroflexi bacterium TSY]
MANTTIQAGKNAITFKSFGINMAGLLFTPTDFDPTKRYPTILFNGPGLSVKEMMDSVYGPKMAERGYIFMGYDRMGLGESEGPRQKLKVDQAVEETRDAISFLRTLPFVDRDRLYGVGSCAGSISIVTVAFTGKRLAAVATISAILEAMGGTYNMMDREAVVARYRAANEARQHEYETGEVMLRDDMPVRDEPFPEGTPQIVIEGYDYYKTERSGLGTNYSSMLNVTFDEDTFYSGFERYADVFYTPFLGIVGENSAAFAMTDGFYQKCREPKELLVIEGANHVDLYDGGSEGDKCLNIAADKMAEFFPKHTISNVTPQ